MLIIVSAEVRCIIRKNCSAVCFRCLWRREGFVQKKKEIHFDGTWMRQLNIKHFILLFLLFAGRKNTIKWNNINKQISGASRNGSEYLHISVSTLIPPFFFLCVFPISIWTISIWKRDMNFYIFRQSCITWKLWCEHMSVKRAWKICFMLYFGNHGPFKMKLCFENLFIFHLSIGSPMR